MRMLAATCFCALTVAAHAQSLLDALSPAVLKERAKFQTPCDDRSPRERFDFVVVGAGAAGCAVANRLTEHRRWTVLLLEAGGDETMLQDVPYFTGETSSQDDWGFSMGPTASGCVGSPNASCPYPRARVMGGCTTTNGLNAMRGNRQDYDHWEELGNDGWGYEDVLPYFKKLENMTIPDLRDSSFHGTDGYVPISYSPYKVPGTDEYMRAAEELGIPLVDYNGETQEGVSRIQFTQRECSRVSGNGAYLSPIRDRTNLFVRKRSLVQRIILKDGQAVGVEYERDGQSHRAYATKEVILSAGAILSPVILMLSGIGPRAHLESFGIDVVRDLPVGENLKDHPAYYGLQVMVDPNTFLTNSEIVNSPQNYIDYFRNCTGPLSWAFIESIRFFHAGNSSDTSWPNMESYFIYLNGDSIERRARSLGITSEFFNEFYAPLQNELSAVFTVLLLRPRSSGFVRLTGRDIRSPPHIDPRMLTDDLDAEELAEGLEVAAEIFNTETMRRFGARVYNATVPGCEGFDAGSLEYRLCAVRTVSHNMYHPCCTCKMGPDGEPGSVVDSRLRVRGVSHLRVVDSSVFPEMPTAHLMLPTYMVAEKGADIIKEDHGVIP